MALTVELSHLHDFFIAPLILLLFSFLGYTKQEAGSHEYAT